MGVELMALVEKWESRAVELLADARADVPDGQMRLGSGSAYALCAMELRSCIWSDNG